MLISSYWLEQYSHWPSWEFLEWLSGRAWGLSEIQEILEWSSSFSTAGPHRERPFHSRTVLELAERFQKSQAKVSVIHSNWKNGGSILLSVENMSKFNITTFFRANTERSVISLSEKFYKLCCLKLEVSIKGSWWECVK